MSVTKMKWNRVSGLGVLAIISHRVPKTSLKEQAACGQMLETGEGVGRADIYGRNVLGRGNGRYKGPRAGVRHSEVACRVAEGSGVGQSWGQIPGAREPSRGLGFPLQVRERPRWGCGNRLWKAGWKDRAVIRTGADGRWDKSVSREGGKR